MTHESVKRKLSIIKTSEKSVYAVGQRHSQNSRHRVNQKQASNSTNHTSNNDRACNKCGTHHTSGAYPAYGKVRRRCSTKNHYAEVCLTSQLCYTSPKSTTPMDVVIIVVAVVEEVVVVYIPSTQTIRRRSTLTQ